MKHADQLAQLDARVEVDGTTGEAHAASVLDAGRHGLEFFRHFGPPYARFTGRPFDFKRDFLRRYESHADIAFGPLREDGERFAKVEDGLSDNAVALRTQGESVFSSWQGGAADSAAGELADLLATVAALRDRFAKLSKAVGEVADGTDRAVHELATKTGRLYAERVDGHTARDVRFLVDFHRRTVAGDDVDDDELARAATLCQVGPKPRNSLLTAVTAKADTWLRGEFVPAYEAKVQAFDRLCDTADRKLSSCWRQLDDTLSQVDPDHVAAAPPAPPPTPPATRPAAVPPGPRVTGHSGGVPVSGPASRPPAEPPLNSGILVGAAPAAQTGRRGQPATQPTSRPAPATGGGAPGIFGGVPMGGGLGAGGGEDRHTAHVPLAGLELSDAVVDAGFVIGGSEDRAAYNDVLLEEANAARRRANEIPTAGDDW